MKNNCLNSKQQCLAMVEGRINNLEGWTQLPTQLCSSAFAKSSSLAMRIWNVENYKPSFETKSLLNSKASLYRYIKKRKINSSITKFLINNKLGKMQTVSEFAGNGVC